LLNGWREEQARHGIPFLAGSEGEGLRSVGRSVDVVDRTATVWLAAGLLINPIPARAALQEPVAWSLRISFAGRQPAAGNNSNRLDGLSLKTAWMTWIFALAGF